MGVTGLWRLIEPAGKPVPIETLENKVLAVDISIWLHQMVKGYQDAKGAPMPNAHLLGLFQRLCKLLYFRIKPVFVFDGSYPELKRETIAKRQDSKAKLNSESERLKREILLLLGKKTAIGSLLGKQTSPKKAARIDNSAENEDLFKLPELPRPEDQNEPSSESETEEDDSSVSVADLHSIDLESDNFKNLPLREKHDVLIELKETRKMNSWGKLDELPKNSDNFSDFQMKRLLKRRKVQECLEETEKEIGGNSMTLNELESLLNDQGVITDMDSLPTKRIASDDKTRYLLISNVKQALEDAKQKEIDKAKTVETVVMVNNKINDQVNKESDSDNKQIRPYNYDQDDDLEMAIKMSLECTDEGKNIENKDKKSSDSSFNIASDYSDTSEEDEHINFNFNAAKAYIEQNTDYTSNTITNIVSKSVSKKVCKQRNKVEEILKELEMNTSGETTKTGNDAQCEPIYEESTLNLSSSDDDDDINHTQTSETVIKDNLKPVHATENITASNNINNKIILESSESDEEFEEVPDTSLHQIYKPTVEVNLEIKDTLEDDIFADVFENMHNKIQNQDDGKLINEKLKIDDDVSIKEVPETLKTTNFTFKSEVEPTHDIDSNLPETNVNVQIITNVHDKSQPEIISNVSKSSETNLNEIPQHSENISEILKSDTLNLLKNSPEQSVEDKIVPLSKKITSEELNNMAEQLQTEQEDLMQEQRRLERMGRNISEEMTRDAQELLQIFGIPYIVAPCEAEAQCAFLESVKLTDGTITDDSDIWLFGGKTVYKNFFNQKKLVMQFLSERIDRSFNLSREQLILLALLVGSDYTAGVSGVGPVTALEILAAFSCSRRDLLLFHAATNPQAKYSALVTGLQEFKKWVRSGKKTDDTSLRKKLRNVSVSEDFPSVRVVQAYMEPKVETSKDKFTWGEPDVTVLADYARKKFGWSKNKLDEILNPVLKRVHERKNQKTMQDYFRTNVEYQSLDDQMSKRVRAAVGKMGDEPRDTKPPKKRKTTQKREKTKETTPEVENANIAPTLKSDVTVARVVPDAEMASSSFDIVVPKLERYQEIIPQREKDRLNALNNKLRAVEMFRKSKLNPKGKRRKPNLCKPKADLSESSDSD